MTSSNNRLDPRTNLWVIAASSIALIVGVILSHAIEPGVRVEKTMLTPNTPALRIFPATPGQHPIALLAHGNGGSKEMLFRFGEALAAAGFDCYSVDQAGYGESPLSCSLTNLRRNFQELQRALDPIDVFLGHSMGAANGSWSVHEASFRPKLFIGVGYPAELGEDAPPLLLMAGRFEEFFRPAQLRSIATAQVVISPWSDHILEPYDPALMSAAVEAACAALGKPIPAAPTAWLWRLAGIVLGIAGALGLVLHLPELHPRLARIRGVIIPAIFLVAATLTLNTWVGATPQLRRIPQQAALFGFIWMALAGLGRLRLRRWSLAVVTGAMSLACLPFVFYLPYPQFEKGIFLFAVLMITLGISTLLMLPSMLVGRIAARGASRRDGDIAVAIFASYCIGQFMPLFY